MVRSNLPTIWGMGWGEDAKDIKFESTTYKICEQISFFQ